MPERVQRRPLAQQAADVLLDRIREGEWKLGDRLPNEPTLADRLGVGRSTVREAVRQLAGKGVLEARHGSGVYVTGVDAAEDWDDVVRSASIVTVLEARTAIEAESAGFAALRRTDADVRDIRRHLDARLGAELDREGLVTADTAFHRSIVLAAHNDVLTDLFDGLTPRVHAAMLDLLRMRGEWPGADVEEHEALTAAVEAGDAAVARDVSRRHLRSLGAELA